MTTMTAVTVKDMFKSAPTAAETELAKINRKQRKFRDEYADWLERQCRDLPVTTYRGPNKQDIDVLQLVFNLSIMALYRDNKFADYLCWLALGDVPGNELTKVILEVDLGECSRLLATSHKACLRWRDDYYAAQGAAWMQSETMNEEFWRKRHPEPQWADRIDVMCPRTVALTQAQF